MGCLVLLVRVFRLHFKGTPASFHQQCVQRSVKSNSISTTTEDFNSKMKLLIVFSVKLKILEFGNLKKVKVFLFHFLSVD